MTNLERILLNAVAELTDELRLVRDDIAKQNGQIVEVTFPYLDDLARRIRLQDVENSIQAELK